MNHKKRKQKNARAGCAMCKPHKKNGSTLRETAWQYQRGIREGQLKLREAGL